MDNKSAIPYLAGFFDGEGCVYIIRANVSYGVRYSLEISFTNSWTEPLVLAQSLFGGSITESKDARGNKVTHRLRLRGNQAVKALEALLPFLIVKKERARLGVEFQAKLAGKSRSTRLPVDQCEAYRTAIQSQNDKVWNRNRSSVA